MQDSSILLKLKKLEEKKQHPAFVHRYMFPTCCFQNLLGFLNGQSIILAGNCLLLKMMHMATIPPATC